MRRILLGLLVCLTVLVCCGGCAGDTSDFAENTTMEWADGYTAASETSVQETANATEAAEQNVMLLPYSMGLMIDGEYQEILLQWQNSSCKFVTPDGVAFTFEFDGQTETVTAYMDGEMYLQFAFDSAGYVIGTVFPDMTAGKITYQENYKSFYWDFLDDEDLQGTEDSGSVCFEMTGEERQLFYCTYDDSFIRSIRLSGSEGGVDMIPELDASGNMEKLTVINSGNSIVMNVTSAELPATHSWQRLPGIFLSHYLANMPAVLWVMSVITSCYIG